MSDLQKLLKVSHASFVMSYPDLDIVESNPLGIKFLKNYNASNIKEVMKIDEAFINKIDNQTQVNTTLITLNDEEMIVTARKLTLKSKVYLTMTVINNLENPEVLSNAYDLNESINRNVLFSKVFNHGPIGLVLIDNKNILYKANKYIFDYFGYDFREIIGEKFGNVFACSTVQGSHKLCGETRTCKSCELKNGIKNVLENKETIENIEMTHEFKIEGKEVVKWFTVSAAPVDFNEQTYALVSFVEISDRV